MPECGLTLWMASDSAYFPGALGYTLDEEMTTFHRVASIRLRMEAMEVALAEAEGGNATNMASAGGHASTDAASSMSNLKGFAPVSAMAASWLSDRAVPQALPPCWMMERAKAWPNQPHPMMPQRLHSFTSVAMVLGLN